MNTLCSKTPDDRRFQKTELQIQQAIIDQNLLEAPPGSVTTSEFCQKARLNRATFYRHYSDISDAVVKYSSVVQADFNRLARDRLFLDNSLGANLNLTLGFIRRHREYFRAAITTRNFSRFETIIREIEAPVCKYWRLKRPRLLNAYRDQLFTVFVYDFLRELEFWCVYENFDYDHELLHARRLFRAANRIIMQQLDSAEPFLGL